MMIDFSAASIDFSIIAPEISLLAFAFAILVFSFKKNMTQIAPFVSAVGIVVALYYILQQWGSQATGFYGMVSCDNFGLTFKLIFALIALLAVFVATRYFEVKNIARPEFYALLLISTMGMMVMANSNDLVVIFIGLEILSVPLYVMAGFAQRSLESNEAGIKYFIMGAFASAFLLLGIAFVYGASATTDLRQIVTDFDYILNNNKLYLLIGASLILVGFSFKVGAVPFHSWVPDVYQGAPTPVTAFFSVGPKAAGFAALLRLFSFGFEQIDYLVMVFWIMAVLTMTVGNVLALRQDNVKRMLAYSSIAHAGYIFVALTVGNSEAVSSAIFYLIAYTLFNFGGFTVVVMLESRSNKKSDISELAGFASKNPYLAAFLALFMFALAGFPPTIGFIGKFYIFSSAVKAGFIWLTVIGVMNSFLSVYYYLRIVKAAYFDKPEVEVDVLKPAYSIMFVLLVTAAGTLGIGFFPQSFLNLAKAAIFGMF